MGPQVIKESLPLRQTLGSCDGALTSLPDAPSWTILEELILSQEESLPGMTLYAQTTCTSFQLAQVDLLQHWNITSSAMVGHSSGGIGAAYAVGILTPCNAMIAASYRGLNIPSAPTTDDSALIPSAIMAVGLPEPDATKEFAPFTGRLTIAAVNSPSIVTISSGEDTVLELKTILTDQKVFISQL
ncbi:polyketide synthase [Apiospora arundinis]|uniref:Polyketide synthase n=1 Tax=Apiospora arundinis TaxID=335852 RepID=A0ABR2J4Q5_9PEZI